MAAPLVYRQVMQAACSTCGAEWFGPGAEAIARRHGRETAHQVQLQILHRETINPVPAGVMPEPAPQVVLSRAEETLSVAAARERVSLFDGAIGNHNRSQQRIAR
ncbi:MAG TPA: hypothetical protein VGN60_00885 [Devosia sp.]|jgi:hypothetical protein|nr:hypothetical protein [Devosia sp.]